MNGDPGLYARSFSDVYGAWYENLHDTKAIRRAVSERAGSSSTVLELGSGSGLIAAALVTDGHSVIALDSSAEMLNQDESGSSRIVADMATSPLRSDVADVAIIAWNTLFNVTPISRQGDVLSEAARVLKPGGWLAIEGFVAPPGRRNDLGGISVRSHDQRSDSYLIIATHQPTTNPGVLSGAHIEVRPDGTVTRPWQLAYQSPADIDASASAASMQLEHRFRDWSGAAFDPDGDRHVSWYRAL